MTIYTPADKAQLAAKGIGESAVDQQLERFRTGFPYLTLDSPATLGQGILPCDADTIDACIARWKKYLADGGDVMKFVPASGAASRMFKALFAFVNGTDDVPAAGSPVAELTEHIADFAFYGDLCKVTEKLYTATPEELIAAGRYKDVVGAIILPEGLNYGALPKALLAFHRYADGHVRTAMEEQLAEGAATAANSTGKVRLHFTVSENHRPLFEAKLAEAVPAMAERFGVDYDISLSVQKPSTDTIAVTPDNELFRDDAGKLVFRPGGHGALIENLNDVDAEVVFIKNIDNITGDGLRADTVRYKQFLGGLLLTVRDAIAALQAELASDPTEEVVEKATAFVNQILFKQSRDLDPERSLGERRDALLAILDRPLRVCGMVRNEGEPGGGPYNAYSSDGKEIAPQILESTQIDPANEAYAAMLRQSAYFNPVDLVCYLKREDGSSYNLPDYVDPATGFISQKSLGGRELRALELPGLWNGAMSRWNTVFVEVPATTFNPVKTVNDLLRPAHR